MPDHIHIENFRLFKNLDIPKVGQVNLITGKNNSGKTTLLEALRIYRNWQSDISFGFAIPLILRERGDFNGNIIEAYDKLFSDKKYKQFIINNLKVEMGKEHRVRLLEGKRDLTFPISLASEITNDVSNYIPAGFGLINASLWRLIELTDKEQQAVKILQIIEPNIVRISVNDLDDTAKVLLSNSPKPLPLKNFGEGMNRLLSVALGLVSAENDMLLIDEIDLGLHHSVQRLLWEIVFQKARDLKVQVFATTHSSDCVQAFSDVANKPENAGVGNYIRLQRSKKDGNIMAVDYEMEELESAMDLNLETR